MNDRPKPPEGHETWLDWLLIGPPDLHDERSWEHARAELADLRATAAKWDEHSERG